MGPSLVAMATKFGLGTEVQSPTGLLIVFLVIFCEWLVLCQGVWLAMINKLLYTRDRQTFWGRGPDEPQTNLSRAGQVNF